MKPRQATNEHARFWSALPDHEFFGTGVRHIYFYADVDAASVGKLRDEVLLAARATVMDGSGVTVSPKPIVIHVHSRGGSMYAENWLLSLFNQVGVPLCVMVDALSASAATSLSVMAPYRVGTPWSLSLLHDYAGATYGKREEALARLAELERHRELYKRLYMSRTRIPDKEMELLLRRDLWLDAPTCLRLGIYDRVVRPDRSVAVQRFLLMGSSNSGMSRAPFIKTNWNLVYSSCGEDNVRRFDEISGGGDTGGTPKPIVFTAPGTTGCDDPQAALALVARIQASPVPVFGIVDNTLTWWEMLPILFCHRRFMYENATLEAGLVYESAWGSRLDDIVHNANVNRGLIVQAIKARGRPGAALLGNLFDRLSFLTAQQCKDNGLIDEVVPLAAATAAAAASLQSLAPRRAPRGKARRADVARRRKHLRRRRGRRVGAAHQWIPSWCGGRTLRSLRGRRPIGWTRSSRRSSCGFKRTGARTSATRPPATATATALATTTRATAAGTGRRDGRKRRELQWQIEIASHHMTADRCT